MMKLILVGVVAAGVLALVSAQARPPFRTQDCGPCYYDECPTPSTCPAGIAKDKCGCCNVCAKQEFEKCDHPEVRTDEYLGKCGDKLECMIREDLDIGDADEAICYCTKSEVLCGSDAVTYENMCQLAAASVVKNQKLTVKNKGACKQAPVMVSKPDNAKDKEGANVALVCEAEGYPIPTVEWTWTRVDGQTVFLPSDDLKVSVNMRGGPERNQITGWLQIMEMEKKHEGDYTCITQNEFGVVQATARVNVIEDEVAYANKKRRRVHGNNLRILNGA